MPHYTLPYSEAGLNLTICISVLCAISTVAVGLRVYCRLYVLRFFGIDDVFMIIALVFILIMTGMIGATVQYGLGSHMNTVPPEVLVNFFKLVYPVVLLYLAVSYTVKASLIAFYRRLSPDYEFHRWCWMFLAVNTVIWVVFSSICAASCKPVPYFWDKSIKGGRCIDLKNLYIVNASFLILMDIGTLVLPLPAVLKLKLPRRQKISVVFLFLLGGFACIASFIRITKLFSFAGAADITHSTINTHGWSMVELNCGIIAACIPTLKPLSRHLGAKFWPASTVAQNSGDSSRNVRMAFNRPKVTSSNEDLVTATVDEMELGARVARFGSRHTQV